MFKSLAFVCLLLSTLSVCNGQATTVTCGNKIAISVVGDSEFPIESPDTRANSSGLVLGYTEYCDNNGVAPAPECKFNKVGSAYEIEIEDFTSCNIASAYNAAEDHTEVTMIVSRVPYMDSSVIRRSECGRFSVVCRYNKKLENVRYETSVNITTHDYEGEDLVQNSITSAQLYLIESAGTGNSKGTDIPDGKVYNLTETIFVEARIAENTDKFLGNLFNCYASKTADYNKDYELIGSDSCPNSDDATVQYDGTITYFPTFSFEAFVWATSENEIYLQCDLGVCLNGDFACNSDLPFCTGNKLRNRFKRNSGNIETRTVRSGPIRVRMPSDVKETLYF